MTDILVPFLMTPEEFRLAVKKLGGATKTANSLGVSKSTVYRWMKTGIKLGNGNQTCH